MDIVKPPGPLQLTGNVRRNWLIFKQKLQLFLTATSTATPRSAAVKAAILLSAAGDEALDIYNFSYAKDESKDDYDTLLKKFGTYFDEKENEVYERHVFRMRVQVPVVQPARRVPFSLREPLREELNRMEKASIIKRVDEPTEWFIPGKDLLLADMLSRAPALRAVLESTEDVDVHAVQVLSSIGRRLRTTLPECSIEKERPVVKHRQSSKGKLLPPLQQGDTVRVRDGRQWSRKAMVLQKVAPRSHIVRTDNDRLLRRNRQHLLRTQEHYNVTDDSDDEADIHSEPSRTSSPGTADGQGEPRDGLATSTQLTASSAATGSSMPAIPRWTTRPRLEPKRLTYDHEFRQIS
ncbi:uncharacterized protein LOC144113381 [Amblyomma americanum]